MASYRSLSFCSIHQFGYEMNVGEPLSDFTSLRKGAMAEFYSYCHSMGRMTSDPGLLQDYFNDDKISYFM